jgi:hypothetical protein
MDFFAAATHDLDRALSDALRVRYPLLMQLVRIDAALRLADAESLEEAARHAIVVAFTWDAKMKAAEIARFVASLLTAWPTAEIQYQRMSQLCAAAKSPLPAWLEHPEHVEEHADAA